MALGTRDTTSLVTLTGWDAAELRKFALADGTTYDQVVAQINIAMGALNAELYNNPLYGTLASYTDQPDIEYNMGASAGMELHTEYGMPDNQRAITEGHMLPLQKWDRGLGWTWDYLKDARLNQIQADIALGIQDIRDRWRVQLFTRLLQRGDDSGAAKGLGTSGLSPGFATTAGSTGVDFTPPTFGGSTFSSTHEHYIPIAGGAFTAAVFQDIRAELREHGHMAPYDVLIGISDETTVRGLTGFVPVAQQQVAYGTSVSLATFQAEDDERSGSYYIGIIEDCRVRVVPGMPQYYGFGYKTYGMNNPRNPLRVRVERGRSMPMFTAMTNPKSGRGYYPIQQLILYGEFGVGVGDRTNGTPRYVNNAAWSDGTPT